MHVFLHSDGDLYLYGAGKFGRIIAKHLKETGWGIKGFVVTNKDKESILISGEEIPIIDINQFKTIKANSKIMLSLSDFYHNEVREIIPKRIQVFPYNNSAYSLQDIIDVIKFSI